MQRDASIRGKVPLRAPAAPERWSASDTGELVCPKRVREDCVCYLTIAKFGGVNEIIKERTGSSL